MRKIPTLFVRSPGGTLTRDVTPGCEWVLDGEGYPTRKWDGTACRWKDNRFWKRREIRPGKPDPDQFVLEEEDPNTGKRFGWVPVSESNPEDKHIVDAARAYIAVHAPQEDATYEALGPKIQGNTEKRLQHWLERHGLHVLAHVPRYYAGLLEYLKVTDIEGIVFYHPDGRRAKIKGKDFGIGRGGKAPEYDQILPDGAN